MGLGLEISMWTNSAAHNAAPVSPVTFNPTNGFNKYAGIVLSNGNLTTAPDGAGSYESVRATVPTSVNAFEFEVTLSPTFAPNNVRAGIENGQTDLSVGNANPGETNSFGVALQAFSGSWYINRNGGNTQGPIASPAPATSQVITVVGDRSAGTLAFYANGTQIGTTETGITFTDWYAYTSGKGGDGAVTANFAGPFAFGSNAPY